MTTEHEPSRAPDEATTAATSTIESIDGVTTTAELDEIETEEEQPGDEAGETVEQTAAEATSQPNA